MSNVNIVSSANVSNAQIKLEEIKNNPELIKKLTNEQIFDFAKDSSLDEYTMGELGKERLKRSIERADGTAIDEAKEKEEQQGDFEKEKEDYEKFKDEEIAGLMKLLDEKDSDISIYKEQVGGLEEELNKQKEENSKSLEELKKARNTGDSKELDRLRGVIKKLAKERKALKDKYAGKLPKYDGKDISKLKTKRIEFNLLSRKNIDGQTVLSGPQLMFRNNVRSRKRLNKTIKAMNTIGNDPKKGVNYIISKASLIQGGKIGSGIKSIKNFFTIRDTNKLDEVFKEHKQKFIENLESKMDSKSMSEEDKKTIESIKNRADYYLAAYKRQFITV